MADKDPNIIDQTELSGDAAKLWAFALEGSDLGFWSQNFDTGHVYMSPKYMEIIGEDIADYEVNFEAYKSRVHPEDLEAFNLANPVQRSKRPSHMTEYRFRHKQGHYIWLLVRSQTCFAEDGTVTMMMGSIEDISDSRSLNAELTRSENELRLIFDNVPVRIWYKDDKNRILRLNQVAAESMNMTVEDAEGQDTYDLFPEFAKKYHDDDLKVINSGQAEIGIVEEYTPLNGERGWVRTDKIPYVDPQSGDRTVFVASVDVTKEKELELSLQESVDRFELAGEGASVGMWDATFAPEASLWWSDKFYEMLGLEPHSIEASHDYFSELVHPDARQDVKAATLAHLKDRTPYDLDFRVRHSSGEYRWFKSTAQAQWTSDGSPKRMVGSIMDIDDLKKTEISLSEYVQKLAASNKELEQFAHIASHDLKAPLRGMDNLAQWISDDLAENTDPDIQEKLTLLRGRVKRMEALLNDILAYSRAGRRSSSPEHVDVSALIDEIIDWVDPPAGFSVSKRGEFPDLFVSRTVLEHVFLNLISNAIKHHGDTEGHVMISCLNDGNVYRFTVEDDGAGIPPEHQAKIFQMFTTLKVRDEVEGSGIGLAIVKKMLASIGQDIWVTSPVLDGRTGTAFHFTMPSDAQ